MTEDCDRDCKVCQEQLCPYCELNPKIDWQDNEFYEEEEVPRVDVN